MSEKVHYEDNLFYLHMEITTMQNGLKLSIDSEYFASAMVDRIFKVDDVLSRHYELLKENPYLIRRNDFLYSIQKLKMKLSALIEATEDKKNFFSSEDSSRFPELKRRMAAHLEDVRQIRREISEKLDKSIDESASLSSSEYEILMDRGED